MGKGAYAKGVPMGGDLPPDQAGKPPSFLVWAVKDPDEVTLIESRSSKAGRNKVKS